jgi:rubrerythrin
MAAEGFTFDLGEFKAQELYRIAFLLEDEGFKYYDSVAGAASDLRTRNEVGYLRDAEARHREYFRSRLVDEPAGEQAARVRTFVRREFIEPLSGYYDGAGERHAGEALRYGAVLEQKSIDFYQQMKERADQADARQALEEIIEEEKGHRRKIYEILSV